jgi:hypothetical protein
MPRFPYFLLLPISFFCYFGRMNDQKFFTECYLRTLQSLAQEKASQVIKGSGFNEPEIHNMCNYAILFADEALKVYRTRIAQQK